MAEPRTITGLLQAYAAGDGNALREVWDHVKDELQAIASGKRARAADPRAMESTVLVHEAYIQLFGKRPIRFENRKHFYCYAAKVMVHLLMDERKKRKPTQLPSGIDPVFKMDPAELLAMYDCLERLDRMSERAAHVVRFRFFANRTVAETAEYLDVSTRTVESDWKTGRAWLHRCMKDGSTLE